MGGDCVSEVVKLRVVVWFGCAEGYLCLVAIAATDEFRLREIVGVLSVVRQALPCLWLVSD